MLSVCVEINNVAAKYQNIQPRDQCLSTYCLPKTRHTQNFKKLYRNQAVEAIHMVDYAVFDIATQFSPDIF